MKNLQLLTYQNKHQYSNILFLKKINNRPYPFSFVYHQPQKQTLLKIIQKTQMIQKKPQMIIHYDNQNIRHLFSLTYHTHPEKMKTQFQSLLKNTSVMRAMYPFYKRIWNSMIQEEQHYYKTRPTESLGLLAPLLSHRQTFSLLTQFYLGKIKKSDFKVYAVQRELPFYTSHILQSETISPYKSLSLLPYTLTKNISKQRVVQEYVHPKAAQKSAETVLDDKVSQSPLQQSTVKETITSFQQMEDQSSLHTMSHQEMKQIVKQVTAQLEKQYRQESKRYGRRLS